MPNDLLSRPWPKGSLRASLNRSRQLKQGVAYAGVAGAMWGLVLMVPQLLPEFSPVLLSCARFVLFGVVTLVLALPMRRALGWRRLR